MTFIQNNAAFTTIRYIFNIMTGNNKTDAILLMTVINKTSKITARNNIQTGSGFIQKN